MPDQTQTRDDRRPQAVVWIDTRRAAIVTWSDGVADTTTLTSDVPGKHRSVGHVRHDPTARHGGGSPDRMEARRRSLLEQFLASVAGHLPTDADITVLGPGTVHEQLARSIDESDRAHGRERHVVARSAARMTTAQLVAIVRELEGDSAPRKRDPAAPPVRS